MLCGRLPTYNVDLRWAEFEQWFVLAVYFRSWISTDEDGDLTQKRIVIFVSFYFSRQIARKNAVETDTKIRLKSGSKSGIDFEKI